MWSLASLRRLNSSSLLASNGGFKCLSYVPPRFPTGSGEGDNEMDKTFKPQDNITGPMANTSSRDILQRRVNSMHFANLRNLGEGENEMERFSNPQDNLSRPMESMSLRDNFRGPMANINSRDNFRRPMANVGSQDNFRRPTDNFRGPTANWGSQDNFRRTTAYRGSQDNFRGLTANVVSQDNLRGSTANVGTGNILKETLNSMQEASPKNFMTRRNSRPMDFIKGVLDQEQFPLYSIERDAHFVLIQLKRNNTHINVTDAKGNTKFWTASGNKNVGGGKVARYAAEATAEYVGRRVREMGLKSVVMRVKGFTYFKKKRQAIMSFKEGYSSSRSDRNPIVYIEDVTRKPHNGCRLPKKRRI